MKTAILNSLEMVKLLKEITEINTQWLNGNCLFEFLNIYPSAIYTFSVILIFF